MRARALILPLLAAWLSSCSSTFDLERPLSPKAGDWLQLGGGAERRNTVVADVPPMRPPSAGDSTSETSVIWEFSLDGPAAKAAPLLVDGTVLFSSTTGWAEAVDLESGEKIGAFPCKWFIHGTGAVADGCFFVATDGAEPLLLCFDLRDIRTRYERRIPSVQASLCAVGDRVILATRTGEVECHDGHDTAAVWRARVDGMITAAPAVSDSVVVIAGQNGDLNALHTGSGRKLWRRSTGGAFLAGATIRGDAAVAANAAGLVTMVELSSGDPRWTAALGEPVHQGMAWRGDTLAVALSSGDLVLLRAEDGMEIERIATGELPGAAPLFIGSGILLLQRRGTLVHVDPATGRITEIAHLNSRSETPPLVTPVGIVLVDEEGEGRLYRWDDKMTRWKDDKMER